MESTEASNAEQRAFGLERQADLVIYYESANLIELGTPGQAAPKFATSETLSNAIANATTNRSLAVVIIGKPMKYAFPEPQLRAKVDAIDALVKAQGFTRVVFQLGSAMSRTIYRE